MARHFASNALTLLIIAIAVIGALIAWGAAQMNMPGKFSTDKVFDVRPGERLKTVSERLEAAGVISNGVIFRIAARNSGADRKLKFGEYKIPARSSMKQILAIVTSGKSLTYEVTIPEGLTSFEVVELLKKDPLLSGKLTKIPPEGSLAPNTYSISKGDSRASVVARMSAAQQKILAAAWAGRAKGLPLKTPQEALTLASIVEKETALPAERAIVASVFINRLNRGMRLQTDPTVIYGVTGGKGNLGRGLRQSELRKKTPWNTYVIKGLPATPIANPGKDAIEAVLHPANSKFLFFVANGTGGHAFSETIREHNKNVQKWRRFEAAARAAEKEGKKTKK